MLYAIQVETIIHTDTQVQMCAKIVRVKLQLFTYPSVITYVLGAQKEPSL